MLSILLTASLAAPLVPADGKTVALKAGTIYLVADGKTLTGGATILIRDQKIVAVGKDLAVLPNAEVVDYGPDAVITPGFVDANSNYNFGPPSPRTAAPGVRAIDNVDFYSSFYVADLAGGVTSVYVPPSRGRLISGQSAVIKLAGSDERGRTLSDRASVSGSISDEARGTPGFWDIPVPATAQTGLGFEQPQLPHSLMGAFVALDELLGLARGGRDDGSYGPNTAKELAELLQKNVPWRIDAETTAEIRSVAEWAKKQKLPLIVEGALQAGGVAKELADAGASTIVEVPLSPVTTGRDLGQDDDDAWPSYDTASKLIAAGVRTAIATPDNLRPRDLRTAACVALRGGLSDDAALRAITLGAAEILGVANRVGSIEVGKDADFAVLNGSPVSITSSVIATYVDGDVAWRAPSGSSSLVIEADELYLGDGKYQRPGQVLVRDGRIVEVGEHVGHPRGALVVHGKAAMPGMIDSFGFLGLEGSSRVPAPDFKMSRIVEPGDRLKKRVAQAGVTTVALAPRGPSMTGAPVMAYKPAGTNVEKMVIEDPCAMHIVWSQPGNRVESGKSARRLLNSAVEYDKKWKAYEEALAKWTPPKETPAAEEPKKDEGAKEGDKKDEKKDESSSDKKDDKDKKDKKTAKVDEEPIGGIWTTKVTVSPFAEQHPFTLRLEHKEKEKAVAGTLRCDPISSFIVVVSGTYEEVEKEAEKSDKKDEGDKKDKKDEKKDDKAKADKEKEKRRIVSLSGWSVRGQVKIDAELKDGKLEGKLVVGNTTVEFKADHTTKELEVAARPERRRSKTDEAEVKGKPKAPGVDEKLEPFRKALHGDVAVIVDVDREDEIVDCANAFQAAGIKPILFGAIEIWRVADQVKGKLAGVLLPQSILRADPKQGLQSEVNRYAELASYGIKVAFHSDSEEGAADLPIAALYAVSLGYSPDGALKALTSDAADMLGLTQRVGRLAPGLDGDVLVLDGEPLDPRTSVLRAFVNGEEVR